MEGYDESTYGESFADVYDDWYHDVTDVPATIALLRRVGGDGPFLELGVGTGRIALPLAATGARVTGVDSSPAMLEWLALNAASQGVTVTTHLGDMVDDLPREHSDGESTTTPFTTTPSTTTPFNTVFVTYNTFFNVRSADRQQQLFHEVAARLQPGGRFVIEAFVPDPDRPAGGNVGVRSLGVDRVVLVADVHQPADQTVDGQIIEFTESGGVRLRPFSIRYCSVDELDRMAQTAGFTLEHRLETVAGDGQFSADSATHVSIYRL